MRPWKLLSLQAAFLCLVATASAQKENKTDENRVELKTQDGLALVQQLLDLAGTNNTAAFVGDAGVKKLGTRLQGAADGDVDGRQQQAPGPGPAGTLDLSDPEQRAQFLAQLQTPGTSGSFATSNSYQQYGKAINYAISLSYAPLLPSATKQKDDAAAAEKPLEPKDLARQGWQGWKPLTDVQTYFYPYYYYHHRPVSFYPTLHSTLLKR